MTPGDKLALESALKTGCCGNDAWRGRLCQSHQAWADGYDEAAERIEELEGSLKEFNAHVDRIEELEAGVKDAADKLHVQLGFRSDDGWVPLRREPVLQVTRNLYGVIHQP